MARRVSAQKRAMAKAYGDGMDAREVAAQFGVSKGTVLKAVRDTGGYVRTMAETLRIKKERQQIAIDVPITIRKPDDDPWNHASNMPFLGDTAQERDLIGNGFITLNSTSTLRSHHLPLPQPTQEQRIEELEADVRKLVDEVAGLKQSRDSHARLLLELRQRKPWRFWGRR